MASVLDTISNQAGDIEREAAVKAIAHFRRFRSWEQRNLLIGGPAAMLAGMAGVTAFGGLAESWITGTVAIVAGALSAISTFLNPGDRASSHRSSNAVFSAIRRNADMVKDVSARIADPNDSEAVGKLVQKLEELNTAMTQAEQSASAGLSQTSLRKAKEELGLVSGS